MILMLSKGTMILPSKEKLCFEREGFRDSELCGMTSLLDTLQNREKM